MIIFRCIVIMSFSLLLGSCTDISVKKVEPQVVVKGRQYSLPKPFLRVDPKPDGTMSVTVEYIPDTNNTYAIHTRSALASHDLDIVIDEKGFLKKFDWKPDSTAVPKDVASIIEESVKTAIALKKAEEAEAKEEEKENKTALEAQLSNAKTESTKAKTEEITARSAYYVAVDNVATLEGNLRVLNYELNNLRAKIPSATEEEQKQLSISIESKELEIRRKEEEIALAKAQRDRKKAEWEVAQNNLLVAETELDTAQSDVDSLNEAVLNELIEESDEVDPITWGPVWYEIREGMNADDVGKSAKERRPVLYLVGLEYPDFKMKKQADFKTGKYKAVKKPETKVKKINMSIVGDPIVLLPTSRKNVQDRRLEWLTAKAKLKVSPDGDERAKVILIEAEKRVEYEEVLKAEKDKGMRIDVLFGQPVKILGSATINLLNNDEANSSSDEGDRDSFSRGGDGGASEADKQSKQSNFSEKIVRTSATSASIFMNSDISSGIYELNVDIVDPETAEVVKFVVR